MCGWSWAIAVMLEPLQFRPAFFQPEHLRVIAAVYFIRQPPLCRRFPGAEDRYVDDVIPYNGREFILVPVTTFGGAPQWQCEGYRVPPKVQTSALYKQVGLQPR